MADTINPLRTSIVVDEPGRLIEMGEDMEMTIDLARGMNFTEYRYYARRNGGEWVDLKQSGNRIPSDW